MTAPIPAPATGGVRPEIQALRAVAVLGVVLYHLWPHRLPGGYVGVDVFFVISGFLITDHLLREVGRSGRPQLLRFWTRRARRLLPASFLTIACSALAIWWWVPETRWRQFGTEIIASTLYIENWQLARQAVDYMALSNLASPVQHFWSLGVEEQFYVLWPVLILVAVVAARRVRVSSELAIGGVIAVVAVLSLWASVSLTASDPARAYFVTHTRMWELAAGGLLAWAAQRGWARAPGRHVGTVVSWAGLAAIAAAMLTFDDLTPFPGYAALLPVLGTLAVILAGAPAGVLSPTPLMAWRPVQLVGDVSYGVYLWHWPLIVLVPYAFDLELSWREKLVILVASVALGWLSKTLVEDPIRRPGEARWRRPSATVVGTAVGMGLLVAMAVPLRAWSLPPVPEIPEVLPACYGALAMTDPACGDPEEVPLRADPLAFMNDGPLVEVLECEAPPERTPARRCVWNEPAAPTHGVALIGDSHVSRWVEPMRSIAEDQGWGFSSVAASGCSMATTDPIGTIWSPVTVDECVDATRQFQDEIIADPAIDTVVLTNRTRLYAGPDLLTSERVDEMLTAFTDAGKTVIVLADPPEMQAEPKPYIPSAGECLATGRNASGCGLTRQQVDAFADPMREGAAEAGVPVVDLTDLFCTEDDCLVRIGGLVVYADDNHLTRSFAASTRDTLEERLVPLVDGA